MNSTQRKHYLQVLTEKCLPHHPVCPLCHREDFSLLDGIVSALIPPEYHADVVPFNVPTLPLVMLVCVHCGWAAPIALKIIDPHYNV